MLIKEVRGLLGENCTHTVRNSEDASIYQMTYLKLRLRHARGGQVQPFVREAQILTTSPERVPVRPKDRAAEHSLP